jgi:hypothetical protein
MYPDASGQARAQSKAAARRSLLSFRLSLVFFDRKQLIRGARGPTFHLLERERERERYDNPVNATPIITAPFIGYLCRAVVEISQRVISLPKLSS